MTKLTLISQTPAEGWWGSPHRASISLIAFPSHTVMSTPDVFRPVVGRKQRGHLNPVSRSSCNGVHELTSHAFCKIWISAELHKLLPFWIASTVRFRFHLLRSPREGNKKRLSLLIFELGIRYMLECLLCRVLQRIEN